MAQIRPTSFLPVTTLIPLSWQKSSLSLPQFWALLPFFTTKNVTFIHNVEQPENPCFWVPSVLDCNPLWCYKVQSFLWPIFQLWKKNWNYCGEIKLLFFPIHLQQKTSKVSRPENPSKNGSFVSNGIFKRFWSGRQYRYKTTYFVLGSCSLGISLLDTNSNFLFKIEAQFSWNSSLEEVEDSNLSES